MERSKKILAAKFITILAALPAVIIAHSQGADPGLTGAPGEGTCALCHGMGAAVNSAGGNVSISWSGGTTYTPGQQGKVTVTITDSAARVYGFEASARTASNGQAGSLQAGTGSAIVTASSIQYITHTSPSQTGTFEFNWTPPSQASGDLTLYVAGNAADGDRAPSRGDHIYTNKLLLTAAQAGGGSKPAISQNRIQNSWSAQQGVAGNAWISLFGSSLSTTTRDWNGAAEFAQGKLPLSLDGVSVTVGGKSAAVYYISPTQINFLAPADDQTGNVAVVVKNSSGESTPVTVTRTSLLPSLLTVTQSDGRLLVVGRLNSNPNTVLGLPAASGVRPFQPGDVVQFYATGLGPTTPNIATDAVVSSPATLVNTPAIRVNNVPVEIIGSALVGSGLYQINGRFPDVPNGEQPVTIEIGGARSPDNIRVLVQR